MPPLFYQTIWVRYCFIFSSSVYVIVTERLRLCLVTVFVFYFQKLVFGNIRGRLVRVFKYVFCFAIHKMVGHTLEFIVWLIFSKYSFQKIVSFFPDLK